LPQPRGKPAAADLRAAGSGSNARLCASRRDLTDGAAMMLDVVFLALGLGFFAVACAYLFACDRL